MPVPDTYGRGSVPGTRYVPPGGVVGVMLGGTLAVCWAGRPVPKLFPFDGPPRAPFIVPFGIPSLFGPRPKLERPGCRGGGEDGVRPDESVKMPSLRYLLLEVLFQQDIQP
ncbi:hypothetical protein GCM10017772_15310 [Promicromonospora soli]|uniref:Uncharacterized protein n=1 Tax=Promicromonospora soli TaxID=2035533 RepID=A0A919FQ25_9MICO|nr:hypothetical protein GCM10017772_15310 [Promicromonospora soli]